MSEIKGYKLEPTTLIPNSPFPLLHYPNFLRSQNLNAVGVHDIFHANGWDTQWIARYGPTQRSHYHSKSHECMAVLSGTATIRFGVADTDGAGREPGGVEVQARPGDVFVIPAGVAHKTYNAVPETSAAWLTPGDGHSIAGSDPSDTLKDVQLSGFTMIGAYPRGHTWDSCEGGEHVGRFETVWSVSKPPLDPIMGDNGGLGKLWKD